MTSLSVFQPYVDKENADAVGARPKIRGNSVSGLGMVSGSVVPIVASYRKLVAVAKNRRQSIETFHYRLSELCYGFNFFRNIWFICGWLGSSKRSNSILHLFSTYFKFRALSC